MRIINFIKTLPRRGFHMHIDLPQANALAKEQIEVRGWAFSHKAPVRQVSVQVGDGLPVSAEYGSERMDVQHHFHLQSPYCGFQVQVPLPDDLKGLQTLYVRAIDERGRRLEQEVVFCVSSGQANLEIESAQWQGERVEVSGWFYWSSSQPPHHINLFLNEELLGQAPARYSRPDIRARFLLDDDSTCRGFRAAFNHTGNLQSAQLRVQLSDARSETAEAVHFIERQPGVLVSPLTLAAQQVVDQYDTNAHIGVLVWNIPILNLERAQVFQPPFPHPDALPYPDNSIDIVIAPESHADEARRVAGMGVLLVHTDSTPLPFQVIQAPELSQPTRLIQVEPSGRHILICLPFLPSLDFNSGARHSASEVMMFLENGWQVSIWAINRIAQGGTAEQTAACVHMWESLGVSVYAGPDTHWADEHYMPHIRPLLEKQHFDLALIAHWQTADMILPGLRACSPHTRVLIDSIDTHFLREARQSFLKKGHLDGVYADEMVRELNNYAAADGVLAVSDKEQRLLSDFLGEITPVYHLPLSEERQPSSVPFAQRRGVVFVGNFLHLPNRDAVQYLIKSVYPLLPASILRDHPIYIVGTAAAEHLDPALQQIPHVHISGWMPDLNPVMQQARISVVPLRYGAGVKGKLLVAMACGTPVVTTHAGVEGMALEQGKHALIADSPEAFAQMMVRLLTEEDTWSHIAQHALSYVGEHHSRAVIKPYFWQAVDATCS